MPKVSQAHRDARRQQILAAAADCFSREGFRSTSMEDIIHASGLSRGAIYGYFASKQQIVEAIAAQRHARELALLDIAAASPSLATGLRDFARAFVGLLDEPQESRDRRLAVQLWAEALRDPQILQVVRGGVDRPRERLVKMLRTAERRGELPADLDAEATARILLSLVIGLLLQRAWDESLDANAYAAAAARILELALNVPGPGASA